MVQGPSGQRYAKCTKWSQGRSIVKRRGKNGEESEYSRGRRRGRLGKRAEEGKGKGEGRTN